MLTGSKASIQGGHPLRSQTTGVAVSNADHTSMLEELIPQVFPKEEEATGSSEHPAPDFDKLRTLLEGLVGEMCVVHSKIH